MKIGWVVFCISEYFMCKWHVQESDRHETGNWFQPLFFLIKSSENGLQLLVIFGPHFKLVDVN